MRDLAPKGQKNRRLAPPNVFFLVYESSAAPAAASTIESLT